MANKNTLQKRKQLRKSGNYFHGQACDTGFGSPLNKNKSPKGKRSQQQSEKDD